MILAHNLSVRNIGFNFDRLYEGNDPDYETCLNALLEAVVATQETDR